MATGKQLLLLGVGTALGGVWIAACGSGNNVTEPPDEAGADVQETSVADTSTHDSPVESGPREAAALESGDEVVAMGDAGDASTGDGSDGNVGCNVSNCGGTCCGNKCIVALTCAGCAEGAYFCPFNTTVPGSNGRCVGSCGECETTSSDATTPVVCFGCGASNTPEICALSTAQCATTVATGACACGASGDAGLCPGAAQVCAGADDASSGVCLSCGQPGTDGLACVGGATCDQASSTCK